MSKEKFQRTYDFYTDLGMKESSGYANKVNPLNYLGLYQMGEAAMVEAGLYTKPKKEGQKEGDQYNNDWTGTWTGKNGINSKEDFLNNREAQEIAVIAALLLILLSASPVLFSFLFLM